MKSSSCVEGSVECEGNRMIASVSYEVALAVLPFLAAVYGAKAVSAQPRLHVRFAYLLPPPADSSISVANKTTLRLSSGCFSAIGSQMFPSKDKFSSQNVLRYCVFHIAALKIPILTNSKKIHENPRKLLDEILKILVCFLH